MHVASTATSTYLLNPSRNGDSITYLSGQPIPMLDNLSGEEIFPNVQCKPPLTHLEAVSSCPVGQSGGID